MLYSTFNTLTEVRPLSKALNPKLLPRWCVCVYSLLTAVCVCVCVFTRMGEMQSTDSKYETQYLATHHTSCPFKL